MVLPLLLLGPARAACGKWIFLQLLLSGRGHCLVLAELAPAVVGGQAGSDHDGQIKHFKMWPRLFHSRPFFGKCESSKLSGTADKEDRIYKVNVSSMFPRKMGGGRANPQNHPPRYAQAGSCLCPSVLQVSSRLLCTPGAALVGFGTNDL